jgi:ubiquinone/menaquinone biosynthesis C-methylase UbiE
VADQKVAFETPDVVIGNHTAKYTAKNPAIRWLTERWVANLEAQLDQVRADPRLTSGRALEVGCGEGVIADKLSQRWPTVVGLDLPDSGLRRDWKSYSAPHFLHADADHLPFGDNEFEVVVSVEVLEHLKDPERGLREIARVGSKHIVLSVPREPIFRSCNLFTGRYVKDLGNTPGHLNHWSTRSFVKFVSTVADVQAVTTPFPWTTVRAILR